MASITVPTDGDCDLIMVSNADPDLAVAYQEVGESMPHSFGRANAGQLTMLQIEGRTKPVAFRGSTGNADVFQRTLIIAIDTAGAPLTTVDRVLLQPIIDLIESVAVPCVTVLDGHGSRWYTAPEYVEGSYTYVNNEHQAQVRYNEIDGGPFVVDTDDPWT